MPKQRPKYLAADGTTQLPSVTTITGSAVDPNPLIGWAHAQGRKGLSRRDMGAAARIGNIVHDACEDWVNAGGVCQRPDAIRATWPDEAKWAYDAFLKWVPTCGLTFLAAEVQLVHDAMGYAGTMDANAQDDDGAYVRVDWKTSKNCYPEMVAQLAAYEEAMVRGRLNHSSPHVASAVGLGSPAAYGLVVQLPKKPNCAATPWRISRDALDVGLDHFKSALSLHHARESTRDYLSTIKRRKGKKRKGEVTDGPPPHSKCVDGIIGHCHWCQGPLSQDLVAPGQGV